MKEFDISQLAFSPFQKIGTQWMLVTAGDQNGYNTMTASWGGVGVLWGKNVAFVFMRPERYTKAFVEQNDYFTLSFYPENWKDTLRFCGSHSGKEFDKAKETGLTPVFVDGTTTFEQAELTLVCRKMYQQDLLESCALDDSIQKWYQKEGYHTMYVAEICHAYQK